MTELGKLLRAVSTTIPGLMIWDLPVHGDNRGWFKENWQREKMVAAGMLDFGPVQNNVSFSESAGTTRGIHAEPWDKVHFGCHRTDLLRVGRSAGRPDVRDSGDR